jgi:hypothetical protein
MAMRTSLVCAGVVFTFPARELWYVVGDRDFSWESIADSLLGNLSGNVPRETGQLRLEVSYPAGTPELSDAERVEIDKNFIPSIVALLNDNGKSFSMAFEASERVRICAYFTDSSGSSGKRSVHALMVVDHELVGGKVLMHVLDIPTAKPQIELIGFGPSVGQGQVVPQVSLPRQESDMDEIDDEFHLPEKSSLNDVSEVLRCLDGLDGDVVQALVPVKRRLQKLFKLLEGRTFGSLEANKAVTARIRDLLNRLGYRVECTCHLPAFLICRAVPRMNEGAFQFQHQVEGRVKTHGAFRSFPSLHLVSPSPDNRRKVLKTKDL